MNFHCYIKSGILTLLFVFIFPFVLWCQEQGCGAVFDGYINKKAIDLSNEYVNIPLKNNRRFLVSFHVVRDNQGNGGAHEQECFNALEKVNEHYAGSGMEFTTCPYVYNINNSSYLTTYQTSYRELYDFSYQKNSINVYVVNELIAADNDPLCGLGTFPRPNNLNSRSIIIKRDCMNNGSTLSHEFGHFFDLRHTHETNSGVEYVNRTNCKSAGDGFCDTPADPKLSNSLVSTSCDYSGTERDPVGVLYQPDVHNIMSYSRKNCRVDFSDSQLNYARAIGELEHDHILPYCSEQDIVVYSDQVLDENLNGTFLTLEYELDCSTLEEDIDVAFELVLSNNLTNYRSRILQNTLSLKAGIINIQYLDIVIPVNLNSGNYEFELWVNSELKLPEKTMSNNYATWNMEVDNGRFEDLHIFPNPVIDFVRIFNRSDFKGYIDILVFDTNGKLLDQYNERKRDLEFSHIIETSTYNPGLYFIFLRAENMEKVVYRFFKI